MSVISFELKGDMEQYTDDVHRFVGLMLFKLHKNVHKGRWEGKDMWDAYDLMRAETRELHDEIVASNYAEIYLEAADVANFAMIIASIAKASNNG
jgi:hypothetical protein